MVSDNSSRECVRTSLPFHSRCCPGRGASRPGPAPSRDGRRHHLEDLELRRHHQPRLDTLRRGWLPARAPDHLAGRRRDDGRLSPPDALRARDRRARVPLGQPRPLSEYVGPAGDREGNGRAGRRRTRAAAVLLHPPSDRQGHRPVGRGPLHVEPGRPPRWRRARISRPVVRPSGRWGPGGGSTGSIGPRRGAGVCDRPDQTPGRRDPSRHRAGGLESRRLAPRDRRASPPHAPVRAWWPPDSSAR